MTGRILALFIALLHLSSCSSKPEAVSRAPAASKRASAECVRANLKSWLDEKGMILPVEGYEIPGGIVLDGADGRTSPVFLTKQFFDESKIPLPKNSKPASLWTYRYYKPGSKSDRATRGSGRDHLIAVGSRDPQARFVAVKGSGTNPHFSRVNGEFDPDDFRSNGLQSVTDKPDDEHGGAIVEWILARKFEKMGVPVVPHRNLRLLPESLQRSVKSKRSKYWLAVQNDRILAHPRESFRELPPTRSEKLKLAGSMYFHNITHGALNPENLTSSAQILDVGHVTFGYEFTSGLYRCTICRGMHGSTMDESMVGILDYYFPHSSNGRKSSYSHHLKPKDATDLMQEVTSHINGRRFQTSLSSKETQDLMELTKEKLYIENSEDLLKAQTRILGVTRTVFQAGDLFPNQPSLSIRLLLQVSAMKKLLGTAEHERAKKLVLKMLGLDEDYVKTTERLFKLFDRIVNEKRPTKEQLLKLFEVQVPASEIQAQVRSELNKAKSLEQAASALKALIRKHEAPIQVDPKTFLDELQRAIGAPK